MLRGVYYLKLSCFANPEVFSRKNISSIRSKYEKELRSLYFRLVELDDEPGRRESHLGFATIACLQRREKNKSSNPFDGLLDIPGVSALKYSELLLSVRESTGMALSINLVKAAKRDILVNTFYYLDSKAIDFNRDYFANSETGIKAPKLYPNGPVITMATSLWVLRKRKVNPFESLEEVLPQGFEAKVKARGMVITGWVSQLQVLAYSAVSHFLSHCGWCCTIESLTFGVPMIAWPHAAEQFVNCMNLEDAVKVALEILNIADGIVQQKELE
ncbi:hypothetical protein R1flu_028360 [Riccia fluitans]|uniref:UDP-glycosyltransferase n=1 Tax=Riccia fluitans TaxID=41844 RepID=A0ABD1XLF5_9MARC